MLLHWDGDVMNVLDEQDYSMSVQQDNFVDILSRMPNESTAEIMGIEDVCHLQKFIPRSYALAKQTGLIDLAITCVGGISVVEEIKTALLPTVDNRGIDEIMVYMQGMKIVHLYFYPKEDE